MSSRAMIIVGAGASARFGGDKLLAPLAGLPLVSHSVNTIRTTVDRCVLVHREDQKGRIASLRLDVDLVAGGSTRTNSERAGLAALGDDYQLIGIHDAARPLVSIGLIEALFEGAGEHGGAIPVVGPEEPLVDRETLQPISAVMAAQTPQVFRSDVLISAYELATRDGFIGHDTADVVQRFTGCRIIGVRGEASNLKVTYPEDLRLVEELVGERSRTAPR